MNDTYNDLDRVEYQRYSVAIGMSEFNGKNDTVEEVFKRADHEMYLDKQAFKKKYGSYR